MSVIDWVLPTAIIILKYRNEKSSGCACDNHFTTLTAQNFKEISIIILISVYAAHTECDTFLSTSRFSLIQFTCKFICLGKQKKNPPYRQNCISLFCPQNPIAVHVLTCHSEELLRAKRDNHLFCIIFFYSLSTRQHNWVNRNVRILCCAHIQRVLWTWQSFVACTGYWASTRWILFCIFNLFSHSVAFIYNSTKQLPLCAFHFISYFFSFYDFCCCCLFCAIFNVLRANNWFFLWCEIH